MEESYILTAFTSILTWTAWVLFSLSIALFFLYMYWKSTKNKQLIDKIPGFKDWPLVGDVLHLNPNPAEYLVQLSGLISNHRAQNIHILKLKILEEPWVMFYTATEVEKLLSSSVHLDKSAEYNSVHRWLGLGLLTSTGTKWKARRHMLTPSFHFSILKDSLELMNEHAAELVDKLRSEACDTGESYEMYHTITLSTLDIICATAMGINIDALNTDSEYVKNVYVLKDAIDTRSRNPFHRPDIIFDNTPTGRRVNRAIDASHQFTQKIIQERKKMKKEGDNQHLGKRQPFLDLLLDCRDQAGNPLTDEDIREEVDTFMFEGHDTTSSGIGFTIHLLGANTEIQRRCQEEIDSIVGSPRELTTQDLSKMTYLEWCIKESMRLFPPVPLFGRSLAEDAKLGGYVVPKGTSVGVFTMSLHRDPEVFPDPEKFDPTRFSPENCAKRHPYAYIPFSAGPRNCIGQKLAMMELKVILAMILKNFNIESMQQRHELEVRPALLLQAADGIRVKLTSRH